MVDNVTDKNPLQSISFQERVLDLHRQLNTIAQMVERLRFEVQIYFLKSEFVISQGTNKSDLTYQFALIF